MLLNLIKITEYLSLYVIIIKLQENKFPYIFYLQNLNLFCKQKIIFEKVLGHGGDRYAFIKCNKTWK